MFKAILACIGTILIGWVFAAIGNDLMNGFTALGTIVSVGVMGGFIIYFGEKRK